VFGWISLGHPLIASPEQSVTLMLCGIVSVVPLWLFSFANRSLPLATLGFFQYTLPTTQFALAILYYRQIPSVSTFISLGIIWAALGLVVFESVFVGRRPVTVAT
jgi:chloramphenicol-sensitive protein RarD